MEYAKRLIKQHNEEMVKDKVLRGRTPNHVIEHNLNKYR